MTKPNPLSPETLEFWMARLLRHGERVGQQGEIPVAAAVLTGSGHCIGWGSNSWAMPN